MIIVKSLRYFHYHEDIHIHIDVCVNFELSYTMGYCAEIREIDLEIPIISVYQ